MYPRVMKTIPSRNVRHHADAKVPRFRFRYPYLPVVSTLTAQVDVDVEPGATYTFRFLGRDGASIDTTLSVRGAP